MFWFIYSVKELSSVVVPISTPSSSAWYFQLFTSSPILEECQYFFIWHIFSHSSLCTLIYHCGFNFHLYVGDDWWSFNLFICSFAICIPFLGKMYVYFFYRIICLFCIVSIRTHKHSRAICGIYFGGISSLILFVTLSSLIFSLMFYWKSFIILPLLLRSSKHLEFFVYCMRKYQE